MGDDLLYPPLVYMKLNILLLSLILSTISWGQIADKDYTIDQDKNIVFSQIIEGLPLQKGEILDVARRYLQEAYKETKYKIIIDSPDKGIVAGEGVYLQFHEANYTPYAYFLDAPFTLRIDAKDGRARLSVITDYYTGKRININKTSEIKDRICDFAPINDEETEHKKLYTKAFSALHHKASITIAEIAEVLRSAHTAASEDEW